MTDNWEEECCQSIGGHWEEECAAPNFVAKITPQAPGGPVRSAIPVLMLSFVILFEPILQCNKFMGIMHSLHG
ncbi:hypothetical protein ASC90_20365 [Rhizobium sp. Root1220]|nr:hypothetical protein ASC90_20365 [Rhizobium sp. Root1220]